MTEQQTQEVKELIRRHGLIDSLRALGLFMPEYCFAVYDALYPINKKGSKYYHTFTHINWWKPKMWADKKWVHWDSDGKLIEGTGTFVMCGFEFPLCELPNIEADICALSDEYDGLCRKEDKMWERVGIISTGSNVICRYDPMRDSTYTKEHLIGHRHHNGKAYDYAGHEYSLVRDEMRKAFDEGRKRQSEIKGEAILAILPYFLKYGYLGNLENACKALYESRHEPERLIRGGRVFTLDGHFVQFTNDLSDNKTAPDFGKIFHETTEDSVVDHEGNEVKIRPRLSKIRDSLSGVYRIANFVVK